MSQFPNLSTQRIGPRAKCTWSALLSFAFAITVLVIGCGSGVVPSTGSDLMIVSQPQDLSVPLGQAAKFTVVAAGNRGIINYEWFRNGVPVSGETSSTITIRSTSIGDNSTTYSVRVADSSTQLQSRTATLTLGPRSPASGDLRFKQIDSPSTAAGYGSGLGINLLQLQHLAFPKQIGVPLSVGPGCQLGGANTLFNCGWVLNVFYQPAGVDELDTGYQSDRLSQTDYTAFPYGSTSTVITGLEVDQAFDSSATSWVHDPSASTFHGHVENIQRSSFATAVAQDGANGRVVTSVSIDNQQVTFTAYSWDFDPATKYDTSVLLCTKDTAADCASTLAQGGYIITAVGGNDTDGVLLVGTKVAGDSLPRPYLAIRNGASPAAIPQQGYAIVGVIYRAPEGYLAWMGEK